MRIAAAILMGLTFVSGCGDNLAPANRDAAASWDGMMLADAGPGRDGVAPLSWVDFAVSGCETSTLPPEQDVDGGVLDADAGLPASLCIGSAPLTLSFSVLAPSLPSQYLWSFGDGSETSSPSPTHRFELPGTYSVSLVVGGPGGTASLSKSGFVVVQPVSNGDACSDDLHCGSGDCACSDPCPGVTSSGVCTADCSVTACTEGSCFDLAPSAPASAAPWRGTICLTPCETVEDCSPGLSCSFVKNESGKLAAACVFPGLAAIGKACADGSGTLDGSRCASGTCSDSGAHGQCSLACSAGDCPPDTACATYGEGSARCVATCAIPSSCALDPLLACEAPGGPGAAGFVVDEPPFASGYCSAKSCTVPGDCPGGSCVDGHCVR